MNTLAYTQPTQLTICIPTYNRADALDSCLFSICAQIELDKTPTQIVISDNSSTDNTKQIIEKWQNKHPHIKYYRNNENIGGIKNFWRVTEYVETKYFWFIGDDAVLMPGALKHLHEILQSGNNINFVLLSGTNNENDHGPIIKRLIDEQGTVVCAKNKNEFISSFWLQELGCISYLVFSTEKWRKTNFNRQPPHFIYPQIRSIFEVCKENGEIIFSNRYCVHNYRANGEHNLWYISKAPLSIVIEFPWLQLYAKSLGFDLTIENGLHKTFFAWKIKQWARVLIFHPFYKTLYRETIEIQDSRRDKLIMISMILFVVPFSRLLKYFSNITGKAIVERSALNKTA